MSRSRRTTFTLLTSALLIAAVEHVWAQADPAIAYVADYGWARNQYRKELKVANADGTNRAVVWSRSSRDYANLLDYPAWSPDLDGDASNGFLGTIAVTGQDASRGGAWILYLVDVVVSGGVAQGANVRELVAGDRDPVTPGFITNPEWSPDLDLQAGGYQGKIAFQGQGTVGATATVCTIEVAWDGSTVQPVHGPNSSVELWSPAPGNAGPRYPTWSPDGATIAIRFGTDILLLDSATGIAADTLTFPSDPTDLQWARSGSRIAYKAGDGQVHTVDASLGVGTDQQITTESCTTNTPSWSPDDAFLVYMRFHCARGKGTNTIRRVDTSNGSMTTLISESVSLWRPDWRRF